MTHVILNLKDQALFHTYNNYQFMTNKIKQLKSNSREATNKLVRNEYMRVRIIINIIKFKLKQITTDVIHLTQSF